MVFKCVLRELWAFLWAIGPQVSVHAAMDWLSMGIRPCSPGIVPQTSEAALLLKTDQVWNNATLALHLSKPAEHWQAGGTGPNDSNLSNHADFTVLDHSQCC